MINNLFNQCSIQFLCKLQQYSMIRQDSLFQKQGQEQNGLNYQNKKLLHMIQLQILDIENTLHYIQKKHTMHQLKQALSQIYNIFNETEPLFKKIKGLFMHQEMKKIMNCFGIIYVILMEHVEKDKHNIVFEKNSVQKNQKQQSQEIFKPANINQNIAKSEAKLKINNLGGIHLYNEHHIRHLENASRNPRTKQSKTAALTSQTPKYELTKLINDQINDTSYVDSHPDQILDIFSFKFKYGRQNQIVTFHDQLLSIANFFKQSQNQAFQFLNTTKQQTSIITYNDSFRDIMSQIKREKEDKLNIFTEKIKAAFKSIKSKTQKKMEQIEIQLSHIEQAKKYVLVDSVQASTQTIFNIDEEIKQLNRKLSDSQEKYKLMINFKKKQIEENAMISLELQNEIGLKNREIVYLKLNIQENTMVISSLSKKIKFLNDANKKIKDIVKNHQPSKIQQILQNKEDEQFLKQQKVNEMQIESVKKQRRMAKKILLNQRGKSFVGQKAFFLKRFTQQLDSSTPKNLLSRNLSEIAESQVSQVNNSDNNSLLSYKNSCVEEPHNISRPIKKISIFNNAQVTESSPSIKSIEQYSKSKKVLKQKHSSQFQKYSRISLLNKLNFTNSMINEDSILDECSSQQMDFISGQEIQGRQFDKIQDLFKKQMNRSKNILDNKYKNKKSSFYGNNSNKLNLEHKINHQYHQNTFLKRSSKTIKSSLKSIHQDEDKNIDEIKQQKGKQQVKSFKNIIQKQEKTVIKVQSNRKQLLLCTKQLNLKINYSTTLVPSSTKQQAAIQTQQTKHTQPNQNTQQQSYTNYHTFTNNTTLNSLYPKEKKISQEHQITELFTRSATQSKMAKNRHIKTLYTLTNKQNEKFIFPLPKNTEKSVDEAFKNSRSLMQMQEDPKKQMQKPNIDNLKKEIITINEQNETIKQERQLRKLAIKCRTLQQFKTRVTEIHKQRCGSNCKHLQKFAQNYLKYKQQQKQKVKMAVKNMCDNINYTSVESQQKGYFPTVQKRKY